MHNKTGIIFFLISIVISSCNSISVIGDNKNNKEKIKEIKINYENYISFKGTINDSIQGNFKFDTGGEVLFLDSIFFHNSKFKLENYVFYKLSGHGEGFQIVKVLQDTLRFRAGDLKYSSTITPILNYKKMAGKEMDGCLGLANLKEYVVEINYHKEFIKLHDPESFVAASEYVQLPFKMIDNKILVPVDLQIKDSLTIQGDFVLDTGSPGVVSLTNAVAKQFDLKNKIKEKTAYYSDAFGVGGNSTGYCLIAQSIAFSQFTIHNAPVSYTRDTSGAVASNQDYIGTIGNSLLDKFDIILDFPNSILYLKPNKNYKKPVLIPFKGFVYTDRTDITEGWIVNVLFSNHNAEKAGLQLQDIITAINGVSVKDINKKQRFKLFDKEGKKMQLQILRDGEEKIITYQLSKVVQ